MQAAVARIIAAFVAISSIAVAATQPVPARPDGEPLPVVMAVTVNFRLQ